MFTPIENHLPIHLPQQTHGNEAQSTSQEEGKAGEPGHCGSIDAVE